MRVPILLLGLVSVPFVAAAAQNPAAVKDATQCAVADSNRSPTSWTQGKPQGGLRTGCSPVAPAPNTPPPPPPPPPGSVSIDGTVWNDATGAVLPGWTITVSGPVNSSTVTDANGHYLFSGIPAGTYTVCEVVQSGWTEDYPTMSAACASGKGYNFSLTAGGSGSFVDFGDIPL